MESNILIPKYDRTKLKKDEDIDFTKIIEKGEFQFVYRPGDDSYLFVDALRFELDDIVNSKPLFGLEIGYIYNI